jgi:hypothetical protein
MKSFASTAAVLLTASTLTSATAPDPGSAWKNTLFLDDFNGAAGSLPSSSQWKIVTGTSYPGGPANWGTGEIETYTSNTNNVQVNGNGHLLITPRKTNGQWTSARIETKESDFVAPAGGKIRFEASISTPSGSVLGYWPAFWALGAGLRTNVNSWPSIGEMDIMEIVNGAANSGHGFHCVSIE